jgi:chemotaxis protein CheD
MYDPHLRIAAVKVQPGEFYATDRDEPIVTVLGSCVAACLRDRESGIGGMNHFMLPTSGSDVGGPASASARYGVNAMELLINELIRLGARRRNLEAKVFGGRQRAARIHRAQHRAGERAVRDAVPARRKRSP